MSTPRFESLWWRAWRTLRLFAVVVVGCGLFGLLTFGLIYLPPCWQMAIIAGSALGFFWWQAGDGTQFDDAEEKE